MDVVEIELESGEVRWLVRTDQESETAVALGSAGIVIVGQESPEPGEPPRAGFIRLLAPSRPSENSYREPFLPEAITQNGESFIVGGRRVTAPFGVFEVREFLPLSNDLGSLLFQGPWRWPSMRSIDGRLLVTDVSSGKGELGLLE
jgi:hypothetical protein